MLALYTWRSRQQLKRSESLIGGYLATGPKLALWTITVWADEASMRAFRNSGHHLEAMPMLLASCDEASVVHWNSGRSSIPSPAEAAEKMKQGKTSKLHYPTAEHAAGNAWPDRKVPKKGPTLSPTV